VKLFGMLTVKNGLFRCVYYVFDALLEVLKYCSLTVLYVFYGLHNDALSGLE
jgi:hypothetical protein